MDLGREQQSEAACNKVAKQRLHCVKGFLNALLLEMQTSVGSLVEILRFNTSLDFFICGYIKCKVYANTLVTIQALKSNIKAAIGEI